MNEKKICPLLSLKAQAGIYGVLCAGSVCKWWDDSGLCCAMLAVARNFEGIDDSSAMKGEKE